MQQDAVWSGVECAAGQSVSGGPLASCSCAATSKSTNSSGTGMSSTGMGFPRIPQCGGKELKLFDMELVVAGGVEGSHYFLRGKVWHE